jgi:lactate racemase
VSSSRTIRLPYGTEGIDVEIPLDATVVDPIDAPAIEDEHEAVIEALNSFTDSSNAEADLEDLVRNSRKIAVVFPDLTRPMPNRTVLPPLLAELERLGAGPDRVELLCATGTHRRATDAEMSALIGPETFSRYRVHDHSCTEDEHVSVGAVDGAEVRIDRKYVDANLRILTGFVEPHFFAGFSGGPKGVCPGLAHLSTVLEAHSRSRIADPRSTWTVMDGNPVHEFVRQAAALCPPDFSVDVTIDSNQRLTDIFCGPLPGAHLRACDSVLHRSVETVNGPFDVVLATNGGYPLDRNLYQAVKGMAAAERVVAPGGTILMASQCSDGLPRGGAFERLLAAASIPEELVAGGNGSARGDGQPSEPDGWQTQVLGRVLEKADVWLHSAGLDEKEIRSAQLKPVADISTGVAEALDRHGKGSRLCVLVRGPLAVATDRSAQRHVPDAG